MNRTKRIALALLIVLLGAAGAWAATHWNGLGAKPAVQTPAEAPQAAPVPVQTAQVTYFDSRDFAEFQGTVQSRKVIRLSAQITAPILEIRAESNQVVKAGEVLVRLDDQALQSRVEQAKAGLGVADAAVRAAEAGVRGALAQRERAERDLKSYRETFAAGASTKQQLDQAEATFKSAEANVAQAEENVAGARKQVEVARRQVDESKVLLSYTEIRSPEDAEVMDKQAERGDLAAPGRTLVTLRSLTELRFEAPISERCARQIRSGFAGRVTIDAFHQEFDTTVSELLDVDPQSRTFLIRADIPFRPGLKPGASGRIQFACESREVLTAPARAVFSHGQLDEVFVARDGRAHLRLVRIGRVHDDKAEVLSGLSPGEEVVLRPPPALRDGDAVIASAGAAK